MASRGLGPVAWLESILAGVVGFSFASHLARDWVAVCIPERLRAYDERAGKRLFVTVVIRGFASMMHLRPHNPTSTIPSHRKSIFSSRHAVG